MSTQETANQRNLIKVPPHRLPIQRQPILSATAPLPSGLLQRMQADPRQASPQGVEFMQKTAGNRAVANMLGDGKALRAQAQKTHRPVIQASPLKVGPANDRYEREADHIASTIGLPQQSKGAQAPAAAQRKPSNQLQRAPMVGRKGGSVDGGLEGRLRQSAAGGSPMPEEVRNTLEPKLGADLSSVKVHTGKDAIQLNRDLGAKAFTHGNHIYYGAGQSPNDMRLTAHEAVHTIQQGATSQVRRSGLNISTDASRTLQRKFGFEIEVPILLSYTDPAATGAAANDRYDGQMGSGGDVAWTPGGTDFDIKVDHNIELNPLAAFEETNNNGRFPHGASITELVSHPMNELTMTEAQVKARAKQMVTWTKARYKSIKNGQIAAGNGYYLGSNMPGAMSYQTTNGYLQATYGIKMSSVPELFRQTAQVNPNVPNPKKPTETVHDNLAKANTVAAEVMRQIREADDQWDANVPGPESDSLQGWLALAANYLLAGAGEGGVSLAKNLIGQYFYKSDMGKLLNALPRPVKDRLGVRANGSMQALYTGLTDETGRDEGEEVLPDMGLSIYDWLNDLIFNRGDDLLNNMKNEYSRELGPDYLGTGTNIESSVVMENRELQYLDPKYESKKKSFDKEWKSFQKKNAKSKDKNDKAKLQKALAKMTDPKKWPMERWSDMFVRVYRMVRGLNMMGTTKMTPPTI